MKDLYFNNFYNLDLYGKSSKKPYNRGKSFGYQILGFGSGVAAAAAALPTQKGIFPFGYNTSSGDFAKSNIVSDSGVMQSDVAAVGSAKAQGAGATYGGDKGIHAFGRDSGGNINISNLITNVGVVGSDVTGVGTARLELSAVSYGVGTALFAFGTSSGATNIKNLVSDAGVVATDASGVGSNATSRAECSYGGVSAGTAIICKGSSAVANLVSDTGVIASDTSISPAGGSTQGTGCTFGEDQGIILNGNVSISNIISNTGAFSSDVTFTGDQTISLAACGYGGDKGISAFGNAIDGGGVHNEAQTNLVSNTGIVASTTVGASGVTGRQTEQACGFGN